MVKTLIIMMLAVMAKPVDVEQLWVDAQAAFEAYRFGETVELVDKYLANVRHNVANDEECAMLRKRAETAMEMMGGIEEVTILDSVKTSKYKMLEMYGLPKDYGMLRRLETGGVMFTTGRGDRNVVAETDGKQFDLYLTYSDGEKHKLPRVVNGGNNENYPFELTDGATLYFSSDGHGTIGGYDLFMTRYNNETMEYSEPMHIGMPFNSIYNDYMMAIDELSNVGWFATDRYQSGDTVVVYKFKVVENKMLLPQELEDETKIATAQMKRYRVEADEKRHCVVAGKEKADKKAFRFVVNDTLVYTDIKQFRDTMSVRKYYEMVSLEQKIEKLNEKMDGKKAEYQVISDETVRAKLRQEILETEELIAKCRGKVAVLIREIRKFEYLRL
ncbi:MAG: hypothetical protein MJ002_02180 [Paludibacteraceae bacterium]|nr:hypothetical protein [Paludibacteraceae bacterium]